jgi:hypothetical protein
MNTQTIKRNKNQSGKVATSERMTHLVNRFGNLRTNFNKEVLIHGQVQFISDEGYAAPYKNGGSTSPTVRKLVVFVADYLP